LLTAAQNLSTGIFGYFEQRITNAYTESVNGRIKEKNRLGRGYSLLFIFQSNQRIAGTNK
jgi:transposase